MRMIIIIITGVAPGATYDPDIELLYDEDEDATEKRVVVTCEVAG